MSPGSAVRAAFGRAFQTAGTEGWTALSLEGVLVGLQLVSADRRDGQAIGLSELRAVLGATRGARVARVAQVLDDLGLLVDDIVPTMRSWIEDRCQTLPAGFRPEVRAWLLVLLEGDPRARPRSPSTLYGYFGRARPHLLAWSETRRQLREVTEDDVRAALDPLRGHRLAGTFVALRSLFRFAKRHRLIFADPTRRLHIGRVAPTRALLPMTDIEIAAVAHAAVTPAQRLVVALTAVHAARAGSIRDLTLDDVDLAGRRIILAGHPQRLGEFVHGALLDWLQHRHRIWPHTPNRHVLISMVSAAGTAPVSDYYLSWHLLFRGVQLEQIRADRVLHEALAVRADPLHLAAVFNLSSSTAIAYADIARALLERPIEAPPLDP
jgi:integrase